MTVETFLKRAFCFQSFTDKEAYDLLHLPLSALMYAADEIRKKLHPENIVTYIIDRNINITNVCSSFCKFCNFCRTENDNYAYITTLEQYKQKIDELFEAGGNHILLQGGLHPKLGLSFYINLFKELKSMFPRLYIHALSPPEIYFLSQKENISVLRVLEILSEAGLDSLPGGGAEILADRVRRIISPRKIFSEQWLDVMRKAHHLGIPTTATMMFGHIETPAERIEHILKIRALQNECNDCKKGFISFIPWTFQHKNTTLANEFPQIYETYPCEYLKVISISRILLHNIPNIQASWLTTGENTASLALHAGANDLGSIMLEENVVASAGVYSRLSVSEMENLIRNSGFTPAVRNQKFEYQIK